MNNNNNKKKNSNRFGSEIRRRLNQKNKSIRDLAGHIGMHYEHVRKLLNGLAGPSEESLGKISLYLGMNVDELNQLVMADRIERQFGGLPYSLVGQDPEFMRLQPVWLRLTPDQRMSFQTQMESIANLNSMTPLPVLKAAKKRRA